MKKLLLNKLVILLFLGITTMFICSCNTLDGLQIMMEEAYFEGQRDAINGDIKIRMNPSDSTYYWIESPWIDGKEPKYKPTYLSSKKRNYSGKKIN